MHIALIAKLGDSDTGIGRYAMELAEGLRELGHQVSVVRPVVPLPNWLIYAVRNRLGWDLEAFLNNYPVWANYPKADIYHLTSQSLATLMIFKPPPGKTVITVHDIIPWITRNNRELMSHRHIIERFFDWVAMLGIRRVDGIITVSDYSRKTLIKSIDILRVWPATIYLGVNWLYVEG